MTNAPKKIVLTGASKGIGLALARKLVDMGHAVIGCSRSGLSEEQAGFPVFAVDVTDYAQVRTWADKLIGDDFVPDLLITNAGLINEPAPLWTVNPDEVKAILATNVLGTSNVFTAFLPTMIAHRKGILVALSSGWGRHADADFAPYCASKFAVEGLTLSLAKELPEGLAAVTLSPGVVQTEMLFRCWGEKARNYELPEAMVARAAPYLAGLTIEQNGQQLTVPAPC